MVNLYEPENKPPEDGFTAKRITGECINIESGLDGKSDLDGLEL